MKGAAGTPTRVRRLRSGDLAWVRRSAPLFDDPSDDVAARRYLADPANLFLVAHRGPRVVGFLRGTTLRQLHVRAGQFFLYEIAVAGGARRQGVGRALIDAALAYCRRHRLTEAFVFTSPSNAPAVALYEGTGGVTETDADRMYVYRLKYPD